MHKKINVLFQKLFGGIDMTWGKLILLASASGIYTGIMMLFEFLENTSFQDIGVTYECWVFLAVIVVTNCKKNYEAMLKCFVFFLISQPLVYGVEIVFGKLALSQALRYYLHIWLPMTFATIPGGFIAFYAKRQTLVGSAVLGIGNTIVALMGLTYTLRTINQFPHHLLTVLFCIFAIVAMSLSLQKNGKYRAVALIVPVVLTFAIALFAKIRGLSLV